MAHRRLSLLVLLLACLASSGCDRVEARSLAKEGNALYKAGKLAKALDKFQAAARLDPKFPTIQLHLGYTNMALFAAFRSTPRGKTYAEQAIRGFQRYMALEPSDERGPRFYLQTLLDSGRSAEALAFLNKQHQANPRDVKIVASLGAVSSKAGKFDEALKWYEKRAALLPTEAKARYLIGTLCWQHLYKNSTVSDSQRVALADRGLVALREALKLQPRYAEALTYINLLYRERSKGQNDEALRDADMAEARKYHKQALKLMKARRERGARNAERKTAGRAKGGGK